MPKMNAQTKREILARVSAFSQSGFTSKMYGNVCQYYQSFVGRNYKGWAQKALLILSPYLNDGEKQVLLTFSKVSHSFLFIFLVGYLLFTGFQNSIL